MKGPSPSRRWLLWVLTLVGGLVLGVDCIPRAPRQRLSAPTPLAVGFVVDPQYSGSPRRAPPALPAVVGAELAAHNLTMVEVPVEALLGQRRTEGRMVALQRFAPHPFQLLVEMRVNFFSQLEGRYRWIVGVRLSAARSDGTSLSDTFEVPVVLTYDHEKEPEAIAAAATDLATRVGVLVDGLVAGGPPSKVAPPAPPVLPRPEGDGGSLDGGVSNAGPLAIYFAMIDRFANGDPQNDGPINRADSSDFFGGDLAGLIGRLDWIAELGVDTLWLSPPFEMRTEKWMGHAAFHGYWTYRLDRVEPRFGEEAQLAALSDALHRRGMKLVLDVVLNHVGPGAPMLAEHPDWFHRRGGVKDWSDPEQLLSGDVHGLPDLAQEHPEVERFLLAASRRWLPPGEA